MTNSPFGFQQIKIIALSVLDAERAHQFYHDTLALQPAYEGDELVGYYLGQTILMLKADGTASPTDTPNPRITIATNHAPQTEGELRARGITISDPVKLYGDFLVGSFLDSEGNKLWFCSPAMSA